MSLTQSHTARSPDLDSWVADGSAPFLRALLGSDGSTGGRIPCSAGAKVIPREGLMEGTAPPGLSALPPAAGQQRGAPGMRLGGPESPSWVPPILP